MQGRAGAGMSTGLALCSSLGSAPAVRVAFKLLAGPMDGGSGAEGKTDRSLGGEGGLVVAANQDGATRAREAGALGGLGTVADDVP